MRWICIFLILGCLWAPASFAQSFPKYQPGEPITDLSGTLPPEYLTEMQLSIQSYPFEVRVVYLPDTRGTHLGMYAARLFRHWQMPEDQMLVVVALDRRKIGIHAGKTLKADMKAEGLEKQELALPTPTPIPGQTADPTLPLDVSSEFEHLDLIPEAIDQVSRSLKEMPDKRNPPRNGQSADPADTVSTNTVQSNNTRKPRQINLLLADWLLIFGVGFLLLLCVLAWFSFQFWRRWRKVRELMDKYSLQGQVAHEQLEQVYESLEAVMPDFHGYKGETEKNLKLFLKSIHHLQDEYEALFDSFETEVQNLSRRDTREDAVDFFQDLELKLEEGQQLYDQALNVLKNLKDVRQANTQLFEQSEQRRKQFSQEISELRKLHPELKLTRIQQLYQKQIQDLQKLENQNERDPLGVEKSLKIWRKELNKLEQSMRSLPHLNQQFKGELKERIKALGQRIKEKGTPVHSRSLTEIERLHKTLLQAIQQGDLTQIDRWNDSFTRKLQDLEAQI